MAKPQEGPDQTREKVLDTAERLFAKKGFNAVSVREITGAAGVHLSAVNYYFGSKKNLYEEVFRSRVVPKARFFNEILKRFDQAREIDLREFVRFLTSAFLEHAINQRERMIKHGPLFFREMASPSPSFELFVDEIIKPIHHKIADLLARCLDREVERERLLFYSLSLMAMVQHFVHARTVVQLILDKEIDDEFRERWVEYLTDFFLHGLSQEEGTPCLGAA